MSVTARLEKLGERHQQLENALNKELKNPAFDDLVISELKRRKLAIKDEMQALQSHRPH